MHPNNVALEWGRNAFETPPNSLRPLLNFGLFCTVGYRGA